jgi:hypothetical protein
MEGEEKPCAVVFRFMDGFVSEVGIDCTDNWR